jgi:uncharacterized protein YbjT (DUF2867 family)
MKILLTGSTGYIGRRLLPVLVESGHEIICLVRDNRRFDYDDFSASNLNKIEVMEGDLTKPESLKNLPKDIDVAYYLVHSMSTSYQNFKNLEETSSSNFIQYLNSTRCQQVIYLSGIANDEALSSHLQSRRQVEAILTQSTIPLTTLRAAIIIGSGSASFEIIRDLVEKLPIMVAPKWLKSRCQPIGIRNVIEYLHGALLKKAMYNKSFDIGGSDILTYHQMLMTYARVRGLKRYIIPVPLLTPKLSSLWLYFVTSTSFSLARILVNSLKNEVICRDNEIQKIIPTNILSYQESLQLAFDKISQRNVISSWKDTLSASHLDQQFESFIEVPEYGCFQDKQIKSFTRPVEEVISNIWSIGGTTGWYYGDWLWRIRGLLDKMVGGVGLRRGRRSEVDLKAGDALDFWRVLSADKANGRLLLYAEMKLPGEAWLEFKIKKQNGETQLIQTATFRPLGIAGRLYWYLVLPFHSLIFPKMIVNILRHKAVKVV